MIPLLSIPDSIVGSALEHSNERIGKRTVERVKVHELSRRIS